MRTKADIHWAMACLVAPNMQKSGKFAREVYLHTALMLLEKKRGIWTLGDSYAKDYEKMRYLVDEWSKS